VTDRAQKLLEDALALSEDERLTLAEQLMSSVPVSAEWAAEIERRVRAAMANPGDGVPWEDVKAQFDARFAKR
jgi:putative addiction module component (TIGR02574 family)